MKCDEPPFRISHGLNDFFFDKHNFFLKLFFTSGLYGLLIFSSTPLGFRTIFSASREPIGEFGLKLILFLLGERNSTV